MTDNSWNSNNLPIPLYDFLKMFALSEEELIAEGKSGRLKAIGRPDGDSYLDICILEKDAQNWLSSSDLPDIVHTKVNRVGGAEQLAIWRRIYFSKISWDFENNIAILPDGTKITNITVRRSDIENLIKELKNGKEPQE